MPAVPTTTKTPEIVALRSERTATDAAPPAAATAHAALANPDESSVDEPALEALFARGWSDAPADLLGLMTILSILAVVLAASILVHRSTKL